MIYFEEGIDDQLPVGRPTNGMLFKEAMTAQIE
jgi:hypothetical protein